MQFLRILPRRNPARRLSREHAFEVQGVALKYPARSWSGVRFEDGMVVFAMREADVQVHDDGYSCLLWTPVIEGATEWVDRPSEQERLEHCRLAVLHGGAEGLLVCGEAAQVDSDAVLALRVAKRDGEYWASWGFTVRRQSPPKAFATQTANVYQYRNAA